MPTPNSIAKRLRCCFNEAPAGGRGLPAGLPPNSADQSKASMRPRLEAGECRVGPCGNGPRHPASMRPRLEAGECHAHDLFQDAGRFASMRPRLEAGEGSPKSGWPRPRYVLQ